MFALPSLTNSSDATKWDAKADLFSSSLLISFGIKSKRLFQSLDPFKSSLSLIIAFSTEKSLVLAIVIFSLSDFVIIFP